MLTGIGKSDVIRRVLVEFKADVRSLHDGARSVQADARNTEKAYKVTSVEMTRTFDKLDKEQRSFGAKITDTFKRATGSIGALTAKLDSSFTKIGSSIEGALDSVSNMTAKLGPWSKALDAGVAAVKALDAGLDAYAKTSQAAAEEVQQLRDEFDEVKQAIVGVKDAALAMAGEMTVAVLRPLPAIAELQKRLREVSENEVWKAFQRGFNDASGQGAAAATGVQAASSALHSVLSGKAFKSDDPWNTEPSVAERARAALTPPRASGTAKAAGDSFEEEAPARNVTETHNPWKSVTSGRLLSPDMSKTVADIDAAMNKLVGTTGELSESLEKVNGPSVIERLGLDDPDAFEIAIAAAQRFQVAFAATMTALAQSSMEPLDAFKRGIGALVSTMGDKLFASASAHLIEAGAHAIVLDFPGAAMHAAAASLYTAGGIAAKATASKLGFSGGDAAAKLGFNSSSKGSGGSSAGNSGGSGSGGSGGSSGGSGESKGSQKIVIVYGDNFASDSPRARQQHARQLVELGLGSASATHS
jgi:uncharacterized membrane protein YgcG